MEKGVLFLLLINSTFIYVFSAGLTDTVEEDLTITRSQKLALDKFKSRILPILPHGYMKDDLYLINWLRAKKFDVNNAEVFLKENLRWRKANKIDNLPKEDFSRMLSKGPVNIDTSDKEGAPVITATAGGWDFREILLTGQQPELHRLLYKIMEDASMKVRQAQEDGKRITRFHLILNLEGYNLVQHGCPTCIVETLKFIQGQDNYYPGMLGKVVIINAPPQIQALRQAAHQLGILSARIRSHFKLFGTNKAEWQPYLFDFIDANQLTEEFGGTRAGD